MLRAYLLLALILLTAAIVAATRLPWWAAVPLVFATLVFLFYAGIRAIKLWFRGALRHSMELATQALRGAQITIHQITPVDPPPSHDRFLEELEEDRLAEDLADENDDEDEPDLTPVRYIAIDMTVYPADDAAAVAAPASAPEDDDSDAEDDRVTNTWTPHTFTLVPVDSGLDPKEIGLFDFAAMQAAVAHVEHLGAEGQVLWTAPADSEDDDAVEPAEDGYPYQIRGPLRVRLTFGLPEVMPPTAKLRYLLEEFDEITIPPA